MWQLLKAWFVNHFQVEASGSAARQLWLQVEVSPVWAFPHAAEAARSVRMMTQSV